MDVLTVGLFVAGLGLLVAGADALVRGAARLAAAVGISPLVVGLTVVAFGTSAPELAVSVQSAYAGEPDLALGNVVGSNICNVLLILGLSAVVAPLTVSQQLVRLDVPLMIGASVLLYLLAQDRLVGRLDGLLLFAGVIAYTGFSIANSRRENAQVAAEYAREFGRRQTTAHRGAWREALRVVAGLALLVLGSHWMVQGAATMARFFGVSELVIGLTIVAVGTSLPELAASVAASLRGERDIAVGNVVGSNLFNILAVLGTTALVAPHGVRVAPDALGFDLPVMVAVAVACLPIFFTGHRIARWEGSLFLTYYLAYTVSLLLRAQHHEALPLFNAAMWFALPLTAITLAVSLWRAWRARQAGSVQS